MRCIRALNMMIAAIFGVALCGCQSASPGSTSLRIAPGAYAATFAAVKDELRAFGFELDRIDARAGVITTRPHFSAGLATPWIGDESTLTQEFEGFFNRQRRTIRVVFTPTDAESDSSPINTPIDTRALDVELRAQVEVRVERVHRLGLRPSTASIRLSSVTERVDHDGANEPPWTTTVIGEDELLAARIVGGVTDRVQRR